MGIGRGHVHVLNSPLGDDSPLKLNIRWKVLEIK